MCELNESAGSREKAEDQESEKGTVGRYKGSQRVRVKSGNNQNRRSWAKGCAGRRRAEGWLLLDVSSDGHLSLSSKPSSAACTRIGTRLGFPDQTLLMQ